MLLNTSIILNLIQRLEATQRYSNATLYLLRSGLIYPHGESLRERSARLVFQLNKNSRIGHLFG